MGQHVCRCLEQLAAALAGDSRSASPPTCTGRAPRGSPRRAVFAGSNSRPANAGRGCPRRSTGSRGIDDECGWKWRFDPLVNIGHPTTSNDGSGHGSGTGGSTKPATRCDRDVDAGSFDRHMYRGGSGGGRAIRGCETVPEQSISRTTVSRECDSGHGSIQPFW